MLDPLITVVLRVKIPFILFVFIKGTHIAPDTQVY